MRRLSVPFVLSLAVLAAVVVPALADAHPPNGVRDLWHGEAQGVALDPHGNVYVAGAKAERMIVRRYAPGGLLVWQRTWDLAGGWRRHVDARGGVAIGADGTVYVAGILTLLSGAVQFPDVGSYVRAYAPTGRLRWQRVIHRREGQDEIATAIAAGPGGVVLAGYASCFECESHEGWLKAWDRTGRARWTDDFEFAGFPDELRDKPTDVAVDRDGSIYVVGVVDRLYDEYGGEGLPSDTEVVIRRMAADGRTVWTRVLSDRSKDSDEASSVAVHGGRVAVAASFGAGWADVPSRPHPWLRTYTTGGRTVWTKVWTAGDLGEQYEGHAVAIAPSGSLYLARVDAAPGVRVIAMTPRGAVRWYGSWAAHAPVDLTAGSGRVRVVTQTWDPDRALMLSYRA